MILALEQIIFVGLLSSGIAVAMTTPSVISTNVSTSNPNEGTTENCKIDNKNPYLGNSLNTGCCNETYAHYLRYWVLHSIYFVEFVEKLKEGNCPQLKTLCDERLFDFTSYTKLVYDRTCNRSYFEQQCFDPVKQIIGGEHNNWTEAMFALRRAKPSQTSLLDPCVQVALFDGASLERTRPFGYFHEIKRLFIPFCEFSWCGIDAENLNDLEITAWLCVPSWCRTGLIVISVLCALLGTIILLSNGLVLLTFLSTKKLRNSQGTYKISLAIADLLVGAVVVPTFASSLFKLTSQREQMGDRYTSNITASSNNETRYDAVPHLPGSASNHFELWYLNLVGFMTTLSITISIYTLMIAGVDRLAVVRSPLRYTRATAKKWAKRACFVVWVVSLVCACVPMFAETLRYNLVASVLITPTGVTALYLYAVGFALPLLVLWSVSIATWIITLRHGKERKRLQASTRKNARASTEVRLARTLVIMVGAFTLSMVPVLVAIILPFFLPEVSFSTPHTLDPHVATAFSTYEFVTVVILSCNSLWNIFIYNSRNKDFRNAVVATLRKFRALCGSRMRLFFQRSGRSLASFTTSSKSTGLSTVSNGRSVSDSRL